MPTLRDGQCLTIPLLPQVPIKQLFYGYDVFVMKLNSTGTALLYSTYIGGIDGD